MRLANLPICGALLGCVMTVSAGSAQAAETLSDILRESNWQGIVGTWVDAETQGSAVKMTYAWKIEDRVIEVSSKYGGRETVALMGVHGKTGDVFHMGADSDGTSSLGKWTVDDKGDAILGFAFTTADGQEGVMSIRFHREDVDTVTMTIQAGQPMTTRLVRKK